MKEKSYEEKLEELEAILDRLDNSETPLDDLAKDVKQGAKLIKELDAKLKSVETEVQDAFKEFDKKGDSKE
jgi:exodeoxyribonuclease VII small subunit